MRKDTDDKPIATYVAILDDLHFEWEDHLNEGEQAMRNECMAYLNTYFDDFKIRDFYLKKKV